MPWVESELYRHDLDLLKRALAAPACVVVIVLSSRVHEKYSIFLVHLSLSNQFSIETAVCHESIVFRLTPWWIDLWASASQSSFSCQKEWNRNHRRWFCFCFCLSHLESSLFSTYRGHKGWSRFDFRTQERKQWLCDMIIFIGITYHTIIYCD